MAVAFHVYGNGGLGGPVDLSAPVATTSGLSWTPPPAAPSTDWTYLVRAFDTVTGLEDLNVSATVRRVTDAAGNDVTDAANPPQAVTAVPVAGGGARVRWLYAPHGRRADPAWFRVWVGNPPDTTAAPSASVPALRGLSHYTTGGADPSGLLDGVAYRAVVASETAAGVRAYSAPVAVVGNALAPDPPDGVEAVLVP